MKTNQKVQKVDTLNLSKDQLYQIIAYKNEHYSKQVIRIHTQKSEHLGLLDSKFGGIPYMPRDSIGIFNKEGKPLVLLAQLNCSKEHFDEPLPKQGILQFFIDLDDLMGLDLDHQGVQDHYRVIYYDRIDETVTEEEILKKDIKINTQLNQKDEYFPFYIEYSLTFEKTIECIPECDGEEFSEALANALHSLFQIDITEAVYKYLQDNDYEYINQSLSNRGHKLLGYPCFTQ